MGQLPAAMYGPGTPPCSQLIGAAHVCVRLILLQYLSRSAPIYFNAMQAGVLQCFITFACLHLSPSGACIVGFSQSIHLRQATEDGKIDILLDDAIVPLAQAELSSTLSTPESLSGSGQQNCLLQRESACCSPTPASREMATPTVCWQQYLAII